MNNPPLQWSVDTGLFVHSPVDFSYEANAKELAALKNYTGVEDITGFTAQVKILALAGGRYRASGTLQASVVQASVVNLEPVPSSIRESFSTEYCPAEAIEASEEDAPFDADMPEPLEGGRIIPVGTLLSELFALALDPYPRNPDDQLDWTPPQSGLEPGPFAKLARLKPDAPPEGS
jgi:hypothetical protein